MPRNYPTPVPESLARQQAAEVKIVGYITISSGRAQRPSEKWRHFACKSVIITFCTSPFSVGVCWLGGAAGGLAAAARPLARSSGLVIHDDKEAQQRAHATRNKPNQSQQHTNTGVPGSLALHALLRGLAGCLATAAGGVVVVVSVTVFTLRGARLCRALPPPRATARRRRGARWRRRARRGGLSCPNDMTVVAKRQNG